MFVLTFKNYFLKFKLTSYLFIFIMLRDGVLFCYPGRSAVVQSWLTATLTSLAQAILLPQPPEWLGLQARATMPS